jgi:type IV secretory pathway VirJ component
MRRSRAGTAACLVALGVFACPRQAGVETRPEGRFGSVRIYAPSEERRGLVFLFSDAAGWSDALDRDARALAADGAAVVGVDLREYLAGLARSDDGCHYLISEVEDLSKRAQRELGFASYRTPILAGIGAGGTLAYAALAQTPAATVAGAISVDPAPALGTKVPLCAGAPSEPAPAGFAYGPAPSLPGWWEVSSPQPLDPALAPLATAVPGDGAAAERLLAVATAALDRTAPATDAALASLPLVELPAARPGNALAVIYSGDGGWRDIDKEIGEVLAEGGVAVVGVDSLRYFWNEKTPDEIARDLERILAHYGPAWQRSEVVLVGYSFGAGILPFAYNRLPADVRDRIVLVSLLGIEHRASFEFDVSGWLGGEPPPDAPAVLPEVERFPTGLLQCFYGEEEEDTLCRDPAVSGAEVIRTTGGHHFDGDYEALAEAILSGLRRRASVPRRAAASPVHDAP